MRGAGAGLREAPGWRPRDLTCGTSLQIEFVVAPRYLQTCSGRSYKAPHMLVGGPTFSDLLVKGSATSLATQSVS